MSDVHIMLMENTMQLNRPDDLRYIFDLKGSRVDRFVSGETKTSTTLKDNNFIQVVKLLKGDKSLYGDEKNFVDLHTRIKIKLCNTIRNDVLFLRSQGLMDYSLLLAIENSPT